MLGLAGRRPLAAAAAAGARQRVPRGAAAPAAARLAAPLAQHRWGRPLQQLSGLQRAAQELAQPHRHQARRQRPQQVQCQASRAGARSSPSSRSAKALLIKVRWGGGRRSMLLSGKVAGVCCCYPAVGSHRPPPSCAAPPRPSPLTPSPCSAARRAGGQGGAAQRGQPAAVGREPSGAGGGADHAVPAGHCVCGAVRDSHLLAPRPRLLSLRPGPHPVRHVCRGVCAPLAGECLEGGVCEGGGGDGAGGAW